MGIPFIGALLRVGARAALSVGNKKVAKTILKANMTGGKMIKSGAKNAGPVLSQAGQDIKYIASGGMKRKVSATKSYKAAGPAITKVSKAMKDNPIKTVAAISGTSYVIGKKRAKKKAARRNRFNITK